MTNKDELQKLIADEVRKQLLDVKVNLDDIVNMKQPKPEQIEPAQPLREKPEDRPLRVWKAYQNGDVSLSYIGGKSLTHQEEVLGLLIELGRVFPNTPEGKLGAELRAKQGILPYPIQPAKALTEEPEFGERYWLKSVSGYVVCNTWESVRYEKQLLAHGRIFPYTKAGKIGAAMFEEGGQDE